MDLKGTGCKDVDWSHVGLKKEPLFRRVPSTP
jgi:hypothetical protein